MPASFPEWLEPMAATLTQDRFGGPDWIFERKIDGIRLLAFKNGDEVRLLSRNRLPQHLPAIADAVRALPPGDAILDGELTWDSGTYHLFDILWLDGRDVTRLPIEERRALLAKLLLDLRARLDRIEMPSSPFTRAKGLPRLRAHWVRPQIVVQVAFIEWTVHGKLRHPRLLGVRFDKEARDVVREAP